MEIDNVVLVSMDPHMGILGSPVSGKGAASAGESDSDKSSLLPRSSSKLTTTSSVRSDGRNKSSISGFEGPRRASTGSFRRGSQHDDADAEHEKGARVFNIITHVGGYNGGRIFSLRVSSETEFAEEWVDSLLVAVRKAKKKAEISALGRCTCVPMRKREREHVLIVRRMCA